MSANRLLQILVLGLCALPFIAHGPAEAAPDVYSAATVITGRENLAERQRGFKETYAEVLAKASGDITVTEHPAFEEEVGKAEEAVADFAYHDRKAGIQITDEQGTRDRSFDFTVSFDPEKVKAALERLGTSPWTGDRPELSVSLQVTDGASTYLVTDTSEKGWGQREVLQALSSRAGLPLRLEEEGPSPRLEGEMQITPEGYWNTSWRLMSEKGEESWKVEGATFDEALRQGVWHTALILSGKQS